MESEKQENLTRLVDDYMDLFLRKLNYIAGYIIICISLISLAGWLSGLNFLLIIIKNYLPIALPTAIFFTLTGIVILIQTSDTKKPLLIITRKAILLIIILYCLLKDIGSFLNQDLVLDNKIFPVSEKISGFPVNQMSPVTGFLFLITSFSLLFLLRPGSKLKSRNSSAFLGLIVALIGFITELGYLYQTPFLYGGNIIPLSLRTGLLFLVTGLGIIFLSGKNTILLKHLTDSSPYSRMLRIFIPLMIIMFTVQGIIDVVLTHRYNINEGLSLGFIAVISVLIGIPIVVKITSIIFFDATVAEKDKQRILEELKRTLSIQKLILENNPLGICMVSEDKIQWSNSGFCNIFAKSGIDCKDLQFSDLFSEENKKRLIQKWIPDLRSGKAVDIAIEFTKPSHRWIRIIGSALETGNETFSVIWIVEDITERKNQRETMRLLSHSLSSLSECVSITDTSDNIIFINKAFENTYRYSADELIGRNISIVNSGKNPDMLRNSILPSTNAGNGWSGELINRRKDGSEFPVYLSTSRVINEKNETIALVGVAVDITDRIKAEQREKEYLELVKSSNDAKDRLFSIISHDLRSPFTSILGLAQILTEQYDTFNEEERKSYLYKLKLTSENTFNLVENLLIWSRSQRGGLVVLPSIINLTELVNTQRDILYEAARNKDITVVTSDSDNQIVFADREMIGTVIRNFLNNAIKFTNRGGQIRITTRKLEKEIELSVSDNGIGIDPDKTETLFRFDKTTSTPGTENEKGIGLGLPVCKEFIEKNGGRIKVESEKGKGSTFSFTIPCA